MKKKNLKSLKLNKEAISSFNNSEVKGGKLLAPSKELSCYPEDCFTVQSINNYTCDISFMYGSCNISCNPLINCF
jgi:hypothetical protein